MSSEEEEGFGKLISQCTAPAPAQPVYEIPLEILWTLGKWQEEGDFDVDDEILEEADREDQEQATAAGDPLSGAELTWQSTMRRWLQIRMAQDPAEGPVRLGE
ncbi:hypothetical protein H2202_002151 [Exophiala xenobiotica]|nr:hypothetical protein H2202_002151 [Exophiala xenobiotica]